MGTGLTGRCRLTHSLLPSHLVPLHLTSPLPQTAAYEVLEAEGEVLPVGFPGLLKGTDTIGAALITDRGFCRNIAQKYMKLGILSPREWCTKYDIPFLRPFTEEDEYGLIYDAVVGRLQIVQKEDAKVCRIT